jgi:hypothetical protein
MGCLCELSPEFAQVAFDKLVFMVNAMETPPAIKLSAIRVFPKLAQSPYLSIQAHEVDISCNLCLNKTTVKQIPVVARTYNNVVGGSTSKRRRGVQCATYVQNFYEPHQVLESYRLYLRV